MTSGLGLVTAIALAAFADTGFEGTGLEGTGLEGMGLEDDAPPPNVVVFLVDDLGWQDSSYAFGAERTPLNDRYHTPHLERLAADGAAFTRAYASAVCSPSRISLLTGMEPARHGVTNWTLREGRSPDPEHPRVEPPRWNVNGLAPTPGTSDTVVAKPLTELFREAGYRTIHVGKAHFGAIGTPGADPANLGFDVNVAGHAAGAPGSYQGTSNYRGADEVWSVPGLEAYHGRDVNLTEALAREATLELEAAREADVPFLLHFAPYAVHTPLQPDRRFVESYRARGLDEREAVYASMIESVDHALGDVLDFLDREDLARNTLVMFTSDNGAFAGVPANRPLRGAKLSPYEGGLRVPFVVRWPERIAAGERRDVPIAIQDVLVTALDAAGIELRVPQAVEGRSILPLLIAEGAEGAVAGERELFFHFPHTYYQEPYSVLVRGDHKAVWWWLDQRLEVYDLARDLSEEHDLAAEPFAAELAGRMSEGLVERGARIPLDRESGLPFGLPR